MVGSNANHMQMETDDLYVYWLKGRSLWVLVHVWFCLCKYLMYSSGTKESKYPLEREVHCRSEGCHHMSWSITRPHRMAQRETGKYKPQTREQEGSRHYSPTSSHVSEPEASCVWSSQLLHHLEPCLTVRSPVCAVIPTLDRMSECKASLKKVKPLYRQAPKDNMT